MAQNPTEYCVLLSGGIDSATLLGWLSDEGRESRLSALYVDYGQSASRQERAASERIADFYGVPWFRLSVEGLGVGSGEIPGRNALLIQVALTWLPAGGPACVGLGIHAGVPYRDCTSGFVALMQQSLDFHADGRVRLLTPFIEWSKQDVLRRARELDVPLRLTHSCEAGEGCGQCLSCLDREALLARS